MYELKLLSQGAVDAAQKAADLIAGNFNKAHRITHKGTVDLVTETDIASEKLIRKLLADDFPEIRFHGEEDGGADWRCGEVWVVDPLDGTTNFANNLPHFCVSIAYCKDGEPMAAAIVNPISKDIYSVWKNGGAWLNGAPLKVNNISVINEALSVTGFPYNRREHLDEILDRLRIMLMKTQCVRRLGSAALDLCYIARGIYSIYWETNLKPWDVAAGVLIVNEAGGRVSRFDGSPMLLDSLELLATNKILHEESVNLLLPTLRR